jgi:hypothetical protein
MMIRAAGMVQQAQKNDARRPSLGQETGRQEGRLCFKEQFQTGKNANLSEYEHDINLNNTKNTLISSKMKNVKENLIRASHQFVVGCSVRIHTIVCTTRTTNNNTRSSNSSTTARNFERSAKAIKELQHSYYNRVLTMAGNCTSSSYERNATTIHETQPPPPRPAAAPPSTPKFSSWCFGDTTTADTATTTGAKESPRSATSMLLSTPPPPPRPKFESRDFITELLSPDTVRHLELPTLDARDDVETRMNPFYLEPRVSSFSF